MFRSNLLLNTVWWGATLGEGTWLHALLAGILNMQSWPLGEQDAGQDRSLSEWVQVQAWSLTGLLENMTFFHVKGNFHTDLSCAAHQRYLPALVIG